VRLVQQDPQEQQDLKALLDLLVWQVQLARQVWPVQQVQQAQLVPKEQQVRLDYLVAELPQEIPPIGMEPNGWSTAATYSMTDQTLA